MPMIHTDKKKFSKLVDRLRLIIAPRDFYDLDFILRSGFELGNKEVIGLFKKKIKEDGTDTDLTKYTSCLKMPGSLSLYKPIGRRLKCDG